MEEDGYNDKDLSRDISFTWSKTTAKPNAWKEICLCNVMVQLLFSPFEGQELFFLSKENYLMIVTFF